MTAVIQAESLTKRFGEVSAVTDLSFALEAGTITGFLGPNGAGKTTTLRMILGLVAPSRGRALVFDHPYAELPGAALRIGAVLEATDFHPGRTGRDHLRMLGQAVNVPDSRADEVKGYSLGMRQRLGLAAALLGDPELLILDEPANGLDPEGVRWLRDFLRSFTSEGRTVLISSHVLAEVAQTVDRTLIVSHGRLVVESPLAELTARAGGAVRVRSGDPQRLTTALRDEGIQVTTGTDHALLVRGASSERVGEIAFAAGVQVHELVLDGGGLEDIFLELTSEAPA
jgi:ABC-2 type transport system ATP-binding protein